jgi:hypothetical protein
MLARGIAIEMEGGIWAGRAGTLPWAAQALWSQIAALGSRTRNVNDSVK